MIGKWEIRWLFILILIGTGNVNAQKILSAKTIYNTDNGLVYNTIRQISRDQTGFLWITTFDGISRFDGYEFRNYYNNPDDSTSLTEIDLKKECVDRENNVWVVGPSNLYQYHRKKDRFQVDTSSFSEKGLNITHGYPLIVHKPFGYSTTTGFISSIKTETHSGYSP